MMRFRNASLAGAVLTVKESAFNEEVDNTVFLTLSRLLSQTKGKLQTVRVEVRASQDSPKSCILDCSMQPSSWGAAQLDFFQRYKVRMFRDRHDGPPWYQRVGSFKGLVQASEYQAQLLFRGVACSSSLQRLEISFGFEEPIGNALI